MEKRNEAYTFHTLASVSTRNASDCFHEWCTNSVGACLSYPRRFASKEQFLLLLLLLYSVILSDMWILVNFCLVVSDAADVQKTASLQDVNVLVSGLTGTLTCFCYIYEKLHTDAHPVSLDQVGACTRLVCDHRNTLCTPVCSTVASRSPCRLAGRSTPITNSSFVDILCWVLRRSV